MMDTHDAPVIGIWNGFIIGIGPPQLDFSCCILWLPAHQIAQIALISRQDVCKVIEVRRGDLSSLTMDWNIMLAQTFQTIGINWVNILTFLQVAIVLERAVCG